MVQFRPLSECESPYCKTLTEHRLCRECKEKLKVAKG
jgi:hypothetical protein